MLLGRSAATGGGGWGLNARSLLSMGQGMCNDKGGVRAGMCVLQGALTLPDGFPALSLQRALIHVHNEQAVLHFGLQGWQAGVAANGGSSKQAAKRGRCRRRRGQFSSAPLTL